MLTDSIPRKPVRPIGSLAAPALLLPRDGRIPFAADGRLRLVWDAEANERSRHLAFEILGALSVAIFVVTGNGTVRLTNSAAEQLTKARRGIALCHGRLMLPDAKLDERLRAAIRAAALAPLGRPLLAGETIVVHTRDGVPLSLMVTPLPPHTSPHDSSEALAALFVGDPAVNLEPSSELVRAAYRLTPAETRVLLALVNGQRPSEYAEAAGISQSTVRTQLKALFAKTGCHRQADLVRKVLSDPLLRLSANFESHAGAISGGEQNHRNFTRSGDAHC